MVPSFVICGFTLRRRNASTYVVVGGPPNCASVTMGTRTPCFTTAAMLFCVTMRGRDKILIKPRLSAMVNTASTRYLAPMLRNDRALVGPTAARFVKSGGTWTLLEEPVGPTP